MRSGALISRGATSYYFHWDEEYFGEKTDKIGEGWIYLALLASTGRIVGQGEAHYIANISDANHEELIRHHTLGHTFDVTNYHPDGRDQGDQR